MTYRRSGLGRFLALLAHLAGRGDFGRVATAADVWGLHKVRSESASTRWFVCGSQNHQVKETERAFGYSQKRGLLIYSGLVFVIVRKQFFFFFFDFWSGPLPKKNSKQV